MKKTNIALIITICLLTLFFMYSYKKHKISKLPEDTLIVGTNAEYPPFCFVKNNQIIGFDIDVAKEITKFLGKKMILKDMSWEALVPELQLGKIHIAAAGMTESPEKAKNVLFTKPYFSGDELVIVSPKEKPISSLDELKGKTAIVNTGYTADLYMSKIQGIDLLKLGNPAEAFMALNSNKANAFVSANSAIKPFVDLYGSDSFNINPIPETNETYSIAVSKKHKKMFKLVEDAIQELIENGTIEDLKKKWELK